MNKKESATSSFHPVMKQIRKISLPGNLKRYWRMKKSDCTLFKNKDLRIGCEEKNMIRDGVLTIMRKLKLMTPEMDPDIHPFPSPTKPAKKIAHATSATHVVVPSSTTSDDRSDED